VGFKFTAIARILGFALRIPVIKRSFKDALMSIRFADLQLDAADRYFCHLRTGYDFFGMSDAERIDLWYEIHDGDIPPQVQIIS